MPKTVLLCDDDIHIVRTAEIKVSSSGYTVHVAHNGRQAWEMIQRACPDFLVTDVQMPQMDGIELVRRIRANATTRDLPVIMLTAKGFELDRQELMDKFRLVEILSKPFSPRELTRLIRGVLDGATAAQR
jgi:two-component system, OmpR family, alkaline phosphatase synthesis response regulator PhoP